MNNVITTLYLAVSNTHTLLSLLPSSWIWYIVLDLKNVFSCIPLSVSSQQIFSFKWEEPEEGRKCHLTWTRLPQGFTNSLMIFGEASSLPYAFQPRKHWSLCVTVYRGLALGCWNIWIMPRSTRSFWDCSRKRSIGFQRKRLGLYVDCYISGVSVEKWNTGPVDFLNSNHPGSEVIHYQERVEEVPENYRILWALGP